jgi:hypothetical protein
MRLLSTYWPGKRKDHDGRIERRYRKMNNGVRNVEAAARAAGFELTTRCPRRPPLF